MLRNVTAKNCKMKKRRKGLSHSFVTDSVLAVVDQGFPRRVPTPERGCVNLLLGKMFAKNCMKMKETGRGWGGGA